MFDPRYTLTSRTVRALMAIEADRQAIHALPLSVPMLESLRRTARLVSTHFSTQIEGNQLSPRQVRAVVEGDTNVPGKERDALEVRCYFAALTHVEQMGRKRGKLTEKELRTIHGLVMTGKLRATRYRNSQNVIRDARTGRMVYLPPEATDVPRLMKELIGWVNESLAAGELPVPVVAALAHYQFATIHPYFDGNGRTARLLTTLLLHQWGYGLHGIYSLDEHYAGNLEGYYAGLSVGKSHNDYFGRAEANVTGFVEYFCLGMAEALAKIRARAAEAKQSSGADQTRLLRELSPAQRQALGLFVGNKIVTSRDVATHLKVPVRHASALCAKWVKYRFLVSENRSTKGRTYRLAEVYETLVAREPLIE